MSNIFVSGLVNIETNLKISNFPINYSPIEYLFNGISSTVSGVGYNVSKAFATLGDEIYGMFDLIIKFLEANYRSWMKEIW